MAGLDLSSLSVMVVEDNPFARRLLRMTLKALTVGTVDEAEDGAEALKTLSLRRPDILFLDWEMPHLDGVELTRHIRNAPDSPNPFLPVIMVTAHSTRQHVVTARDAGVTEFLIKPFSAAGVYSRIRAVVERPRPFVRVKHYFGPDRRRKDDTAYRGPDRRGAERPTIPPPPMEAEMSQAQVDTYYFSGTVDDAPEAAGTAPEKAPETAAKAAP